VGGFVYIGWALYSMYIALCLDNASERFRTLPNASERFRTLPNANNACYEDIDLGTLRIELQPSTAAKMIITRTTARISNRQQAFPRALF